MYMRNKNVIKLQRHIYYNGPFPFFPLLVCLSGKTVDKDQFSRWTFSPRLCLKHLINDALGHVDYSDSKNNRIRVFGYRHIYVLYLYITILFQIKSKTVRKGLIKASSGYLPIQYTTYVLYVLYLWRWCTVYLRNKKVVKPHHGFF